MCNRKRETTESTWDIPSALATISASTDSKGISLLPLNADEKIIIQPGKAIKGKELRILINKDPAIKKKSEEK